VMKDVLSIYSREKKSNFLLVQLSILDENQ